MSPPRKVARLWRTVRYLTPVQVYGRLWFRLARPRPDQSPAPLERRRPGNWQLPARRTPSLVGRVHFWFLNEGGSLSEQGWDDPEKAKLWRYNQHYFDDLNARDAPERAEWHRALITAWLLANEPGKGTGWEPYPTSLRIVNWIKWALSGGMLSDQALQSLAVQARWLTKRLEWHLLGNHLFANAKALMFAGLYFEGSEAETWLAQGRDILKQQIPEQLLADGGQFELSPMYHALALEDMLDLVNISRAFARDEFAEEFGLRIPGMLHWLKAMSHPDGRISFFNDAAFAIGPENAELFDYAARLGFAEPNLRDPLCLLMPSGYARMTRGSFVLFADLARVGPDYLPGHAHADTLSFELSFAGQRVFVNSGTSEYGTGPERLRQRGTAAHNTVVVSGRDSSEVWSGFRVGRRARPYDLVVEDRGERLCAEAWHDGYRYLPGSPKVHRIFELGNDSLTIKDSVSSNLPAEAFFHLHPEIVVTEFEETAARLQLPDGSSLLVEFEGGEVRLESSTWHPEFGLTLPSRSIVLPLHEGKARLTVVRH